jgi:kynurenine formamidase
MGECHGRRVAGVKSLRNLVAQKKVSVSMISFVGCRVVDLSPRIKARVHRVDGSIEEGTTDPYGKPWVMQEGRFPGDNSLFTLYSAPADDAVWHQERMTSHNGAHVQGGKGHIDHWPGMPANMQGVWEMPLETFVGPASVVSLDHLEPRADEQSAGYPLGEGYKLTSQSGDLRGQEILPEHLASVEQGDILLMTSCYEGLQQPWLSASTVTWLIEDRQIRMLGLQATGVQWQYALKAEAPANSPIRRMLLGANVPIAHPLVNIDTLQQGRVFYFGMPLHTPKMEASFIRAMALEAPDT